MSEKLFKNISMHDEKIMQALSEVGVFITDYESGETLVSNIWKTIPEHFKVNSEDTHFLDYIHEDDRERVKQALSDLYKENIYFFHEIFRIALADGSHRWIHSYGKLISRTKEGRPGLFIGSDSDISDLKKAEEKLLDSIEKEKTRAEELNTIHQVVSIISASLDMEETVSTILKQIHRIIPYETGSVQLLRGDFLTVIGADGFEDNKEICKMQFKYPETDSLSTKALQEKIPILSHNVPRDFPSFSHPGKGPAVLSWLGIPLIGHGENIGLMTLDGYKKDNFTNHHRELAQTIGDNISIALENSMLHERAYKMAMEDGLTGIGNRHRFQMEGRFLFESAIRSGSPLSLAMLDIDHFKRVNDRYGHDKGDLVLQKIAGICSQELRVIDLIARYGGEEFVLVLPETNKSEAFTAIDRLRQIIGKSVYPDIDQNVTISAGVYSAIPVQNEKINHFVTNADKALYKAKNNGRNKVCVFTDENS